MIIACTIFFLLDTSTLYSKIEGTTLMYSFVSYPFVAIPLLGAAPFMCICSILIWFGGR